MSSPMAPGACAPSTSTGTPRARQRAATSATGIASALSEVTWSISTMRVRGPMPDSIASITRSGVGGYGIVTVRTRAPRSRVA